MMTIPERLHFTGIGGIGMSAIAKVLLEEGYSISGSDLKISPLTGKLAALGAQIFEGHAAGNVGDAELVVYSSAVPQDNPELQEGLRRGLPVVKRAEVLAWLISRQYGVAVAGTHGKTTTSSMLSLIALDAGLDPTILVGGELANLDTNARSGKGRALVAEADEFDGTFLKLRPQIAVVTNIEPDHLDFYQSFDNIVDAFYQFMDSVPSDGHIVVCLDDEVVRSYVDKRSGDKRLITYGLDSQALWQASGIAVNEAGGHDFKVERDGQSCGEFSLSVPGRHNVSNALAAIAASRLLGVSLDAARRTLHRFRGARRRFELKGDFRGAPVIDDYAHHPTEVRATLRAARERFPGRRLICVFQPHTYSRTKYLLDEFAKCFDDADLVVIADIYASRERDTLGISSADLISAMRHPNVRHIGVLKDIAEWLIGSLEENDVLLTLGAGDVGKVGELVIEYGGSPEADKMNHGA
ncbi:MAG: UDP-N-acetylmuramate--L-alanine ligase [Chloroflexi bacterium]|nr:UDP-N-acetylmuramate--L-alanine ligase [Chloroflexota bacterium]